MILIDAVILSKPSPSSPTQMTSIGPYQAQAPAPLGCVNCVNPIARSLGDASLGPIGSLYDFFSPGTTAAFRQRDAACAIPGEGTACATLNDVYSAHVDRAVKRMMLTGLLVALGIGGGVLYYRKTRKK